MIVTDTVNCYTVHPFDEETSSDLIAMFSHYEDAVLFINARFVYYPEEFTNQPNAWLGMKIDHYVQGLDEDMCYEDCWQSTEYKYYHAS